jgi:hypothetical protein
LNLLTVLLTIKLFVKIKKSIPFNRFLTYTIGVDRDWRECKDRQLWVEIVDEREIGRQFSHSRAFMAMPVSYYWANGFKQEDFYGNFP